MAHFHEYPLAMQLYPSQHSDYEIDRCTSITSANKNPKPKPRKILRARRLIKKSPEATSEYPKELKKSLIKLQSKPNTFIPSPNGARVSTVAFRAIQKYNCNRKFSNCNVRFSDNSFLENERLFATEDDGDKELLENVQQQQLEQNDLTSESITKISKRKSFDPINTLPKKRRTFENAQNTCKQPNITKSISSPPKTPNVTKPTFKPKPMPNFSRIFQVQSANTENIIEYKERKANRAAKLLSGAKPTRINSTPIPRKTPKIKKELTFTTEYSPNIARLPRFNELVCTPYPRNREKPEDMKWNKIKPSSNKILNKFTFNESNVNVTNRSKHLRSVSKADRMSCCTPNNDSTVPINLFQYTQDKEQIRNMQLDTVNKFGFHLDNKTRGSKHVHMQSVFKSTPKFQTKSQSESNLSGNRIYKILKSPKKPTVKTGAHTGSVINVSKCTPNIEISIESNLSVCKINKLPVHFKESKPSGSNISKLPVHFKDISQRKAGIETVQSVKKVTPKSLKTTKTKPPAKIVTNEIKPCIVLQLTKANVHRAKKDDFVKAIQTKTRVQDREAVRRHEIKGVRLNRRFQLLMQMRGDNSNL